MQQTLRFALVVVGFCFTLGNPLEPTDEELVRLGYSEEQDPRCYGETGAFPIVDDCRHFLRCVNGRSIVKECQADFLFDRYEYCTLPEKAECETSDIDRSEPIYVCPEDSGYFMHPFDCTKFFVCTNGRPNERSCPEGQTYRQFAGCVPEKCTPILSGREEHTVRVRQRVD